MRLGCPRSERQLSWYLNPKIRALTPTEDAALSQQTIAGVNPIDSQGVDLRVRKVIAESLCVELEDVALKASLIKDLGAESIDFLDIMFRLEKEFDIKIPQREIERQARGGLEPQEFEVDGVLQAKGVERLKELIPEIDPGAWREGMALRELPALFTVEVFCGIVKRKLDGSLFGAGGDAASTSTEAGT
jgi:acyl carrier protein